MMRQIKEALLFFAAIICALVVLAALVFLLSGCGRKMNARDLQRVHVITCGSVLDVYAEAVDAGLEIGPEDELLIESCGGI